MNLFNCGVVVVTPNGGNTAPNPTPLVLNVLQDMQ